jgi:hypothetical protein
MPQKVLNNDEKIAAIKEVAVTHKGLSGDFKWEEIQRILADTPDGSKTAIGAALVAVCLCSPEQFGGEHSNMCPKYGPTDEV